MIEMRGIYVLAPLAALHIDVVPVVEITEKPTILDNPSVPKNKKLKKNKKHHSYLMTVDNHSIYVLYHVSSYYVCMYIK